MGNLHKGADGALGISDFQIVHRSLCFCAARDGFHAESHKAGAKRFAIQFHPGVGFSAFHRQQPPQYRVSHHSEIEFFECHVSCPPVQSLGYAETIKPPLGSHVSINSFSRTALPLSVNVRPLHAGQMLWQLGAMKVNAAYILPTPLQILEKLWQLRDVLFTVHLPATMLVTLVGLAISLVLGLGLAVLMDASLFCRKAIYPVVVASQTIPTTAIAPLFVLWFGYGIWSKVLVTVLITFFPITITVYDGLQSAKVEMTELLLTYGASRRDIFFKIKVPCTLPYFFSAIKMAIPMSIIGAAIGEWLGAQSGLGYFSRRMMTQLDGAGVFAPIVLLSAVAMLAVALVALVEKKVVRWRGEF